MKSKLVSVRPAALNGLTFDSPMPRQMTIFKHRQIPLVIDESFTMVMEMPGIATVVCDHSGKSCYQNTNHQKVDSFIERADLLSRDELAAALLVPRSEVFSSSLHDCVPCVGCRRSMEELFNRLRDQQLSQAIEPLMITPRGEMSVTHDVLYDPRQLYTILSSQAENLNDAVDAIHKNRRNKRCHLHSLDSHKVRLISTWIDIWDAMAKPCREEVTTIPACTLKTTTDAYLSKHRFCSECKSKVMTAFHILVQDQKPPADKDFCPTLYQGLRYCPKERHLHVLCETDFIGGLVNRAEPDLCGVRRERHAKTLDSAQEEILTCLGLHIYDRLHRIRQKALAEEQTWSLLVHVGMFKLQKAFEVALDAKHGMTRIELICEEIDKEDEEKQLRREQKKQRKKAKKKNKMAARQQETAEEAAKLKPHRCCEAEKENDPNCPCLSPQAQVDPKPPSPKPTVKGPSPEAAKEDHSYDVSDHVTDDKGERGSSGSEQPSSLGEICADCNGEKSTSSSRTNSVQGSSKCENDRVAKICRCSNEKQLRQAVGWTQTLQDMLEETHLFHEEDCKLKPEEIDEFHASHKSLERQRAQLRRNLHQRFWQKVGSNTATAATNIVVAGCNQRNIAKA